MMLCRSKNLCRGNNAAEVKYLVHIKGRRPPPLPPRLIALGTSSFFIRPRKLRPIIASTYYIDSRCDLQQRHNARNRREVARANGTYFPSESSRATTTAGVCGSDAAAKGRLIGSNEENDIPFYPAENRATFIVVYKDATCHF